MTAIMDAVGVKVFLNLTGNCALPFDDKGYTIRRRDFDDYRTRWMTARPGRFAAFTMSEFARWDDFTLDLDHGFAEECIAAIEADVRRGAIGLKVTKELGLRFHTPDGAMIAVDDPRLSPIWKRAGDLGLPVLIHTSQGGVSGTVPTTACASSQAGPISGGSAQLRGHHGPPPRRVRLTNSSA